MAKYYVTAVVSRPMTGAERAEVGGMDGLMFAGRIKAIVRAEDGHSALAIGRKCIEGNLKKGCAIGRIGYMPVEDASKLGDAEHYAQMETATWLCYYRKAAGMTLQQLSDASGVNIRQIIRVEQGEGEIGNMTAQNVLALADALGVTTRELLDGPEATAS